MSLAMILLIIMLLVLGAIQICVGDGFIRSGGGSTRCCAIG